VDAPGSAPVDAPLAAPVDELLLPRRWTRQFRPRLSRLSEPLWATADTAVDPGVGIDILQKNVHNIKPHMHDLFTKTVTDTIIMQ
jgi:hypothetical protein